MYSSILEKIVEWMPYNTDRQKEQPLLVVDLPLLLSESVLALAYPVDVSKSSFLPYSGQRKARPSLPFSPQWNERYRDLNPNLTRILGLSLIHISEPTRPY